ncbi:type VI secretion system secreted protein VgrG [Rhodobacter sp. JA431]|uniref:type VI secretion system Vgr family protein n=1 Tax=Rhodobacter sp. JA431 TaxID=570013 RepID=UPI000BD105DB|nr:type VI secretion system tip protein TssI/VgrG [Rhodobacter sp. JA431]SOC03943.1 type VI secretion system secreted protein VgrG [Rhodobacter sp. JA431]
MTVDLRQSDRLGRLKTALGDDVLVLLRFEGTDYLNDLFEYRVEALSTDADINFDDLIGTHATVEIENGDEDRPFDGIVTRARWIGPGEGGHRYEMVLRPRVWLASLRRNQRIFHNMTVVDILGELLGDYGGLDVMVMRNYPELEYTVQYRESDLAFARRQMERFGISFHFLHEVGNHRMVLTDDPSAHETIGTRAYVGFDAHHQSDEEHFWSWETERNLTTGAIKLTDYEFKKPNQAMEVVQQGDAQYAEGSIESFDYPGDYLSQGDGRAMVRLGLDRARGGDARVRASGDVVTLAGGLRVTLGSEQGSNGKVPGQGDSYICLSAHHRFVGEGYATGGADADEVAFRGAYVLIPEKSPLAPPLRSPIPSVQGPQTAKVVGEGEIDCDEHGRILVQFHWDLDGAYSMRCRVSQNWAGAGWGGMIIPRIGMEVVVEFLEGDPDKPLVTGCVYNGSNTPPYDLPGKKTVSTWKSNTHKGSGYNEFRFEDEAGSEEVFMHAQKDHNTVIENDETHQIGHDRAKTVGNDQSEQIGHDKSSTVGNDKTITVANNHTESIGHDMVLTVGNNTTTTVGASATTTIGAASSLTIGADSATTIGAGSTYVVSNDAIESIGSSHSVSIGKSASETVGKSKTVVVGDELALIVGKSQLIMKKDGTITLTGKNITVTGSGNATVTAKGKMVLKASSTVTVKGSKVLQN